MKCATTICEAPATHRYTWPGSPESFSCEPCARRARGVATAMGFELQLQPFELEPPATDGELRELQRVEFLASMLVDSLQGAGVPQRTAILGLSKALSHYCASFVHEADVDKALTWIGDAVRHDWRAARNEDTCAHGVAWTRVCERCPRLEPPARFQMNWVPGGLGAPPSGPPTMSDAEVLTARLAQKGSSRS